MLLLSEFSPILPEFGMLFWTSIVFLLVWFVLGKTAFRPIAQALKDRENSIDEALKSAENARKEMQNLHTQNEKLLAEAREERAMMLKEAKETKDAIINEAKNKAKEEATKIVSGAMQQIDQQKKVAMDELKGQVGSIALEIAEKVLRKDLKNSQEHKSYVSSLVNEIKLN